MMKFVAFEKGRAGPRQPRPPAAELLQQWNDALASARPGIRFEASFGVSGNYVLSSAEPRSVVVVSQHLQDNLRRQFAVFTVEEFLEWLDSLERDLSDPPKVSIEREPNPGAVMDVNPEGGVPGRLPAPPTDSETWTSSEFAVPRVRGVWKNDLLRAGGGRDPNKREGTWGALSQAMKDAYGGDWTARAIRTLRGLARKAKDRANVVSSPASPPGSVTVRVPVHALPSHDVSTLLRATVHVAHISRAISALVDAYDAGASAIHLVVQARRIAEMLARETCRAHGLDTAGRQLVDLCRDIAGRRLLTDKQQTLLHTLRKLGNFAAHEAQENDVDGADVEAALWMLLALARDPRTRRCSLTAKVDAPALRRALDTPEIVELYRELAEEDVALAEEGIAEYRRQLNTTDGR